MTNKQKGILSIVVPLLVLVLSICINIILTFVKLQLTPQPDKGDVNFLNTQYPDWITLVTTLNVALSIAAIILMIVGIPLGIYLLTRKEPNTTADYFEHLKKNNDKYTSLTDDQITYIHNWSWSAFFFPFFWTLGNKMYLWTLGSCIPLVNIYVSIKVAIDGRKMSWEQHAWTSFDTFKQRQKMVAWIILAVLICLVALDVIEYTMKNPEESLYTTNSMSDDTTNLIPKDTETSPLVDSTTDAWVRYTSQDKTITFEYPASYHVLDNRSEDARIYVSPQEIVYSEFGGGYFEPIEIYTVASAYIDALPAMLVSTSTYTLANNTHVLRGMLPEQNQYADAPVALFTHENSDISILVIDRFGVYDISDLISVATRIAETI